MRCGEIRHERPKTEKPHTHTTKKRKESDEEENDDEMSKQSKCGAWREEC